MTIPADKLHFSLMKLKIHQTEALAFDTELLLETLADLSDEELQKIFRDVLQAEIGAEKSSRSVRLLRLKDLQDGVFLTVHACGQRTVEKMMTVLKKMNRPDLVQRLSDHRSAFQSKRNLSTVKLTLNISETFEVYL